MNRVRRAFLMAILEQYALVFISLAMVAAMSRLLNASEIGVAAIGMGTAAVAFSTREFVTSEFLIQRDEVSDEDVRTGFTLLLGFSLAIAATLTLSSSYIASFYSHPDLRDFIILLAIAGVFDALSGSVAAMLRRNMEFGALTRINAVSGALNAAIAICLAGLGFGFMSFAWGLLASSVAKSSLSFLAHPVAGVFRPSLRGWRVVLRFGIYKGTMSIVDRVYENLPPMILGRIMPIAFAGLYNRANLISGIPDRFVLSAVYSVTFPALAVEARLRKDITAPYLKAVGYITVLYWPCLVGLAILAYPAVRLGLGSNWLAAVPLVRILALAAVFWFPCVLAYPVLLALGENRSAFLSQLIGRCASAVILCAASPFGVTALAASQFIAIPFQMVVALIFTKRHIPYEWRQLLAISCRSGGVTLLAMAGPLLIAAAGDFRFEQSFPEALLSIVLSFFGWLAGVILLKHPFLEEIRNLIGAVAPRRLTNKPNVAAE